LQSQVYVTIPDSEVSKPFSLFYSTWLGHLDELLLELYQGDVFPVLNYTWASKVLLFNTKWFCTCILVFSYYQDYIPSLIKWIQRKSKGQIGWVVLTFRLSWIPHYFICDQSATFTSKVYPWLILVDREFKLLLIQDWNLQHSFRFSNTTTELQP